MILSDKGCKVIHNYSSETKCRRNTKGLARMLTADIFIYIHKASHIYMHSYTTGMYTLNTHAYTYLSTYTSHPTHVHTHSPHTYTHAMLMQASLPGAWPQVTTWGRTDKGKLPGPSQILSTTPTCRKGLQGGPSGQINASTTQQWLAMAASAKVGTADKYSFYASICGLWGVVPSWEEWVKSFWGVDHSDYWVHFSWMSLAIFYKDGKESVQPQASHLVLRNRLSLGFRISSMMLA